jgi:antitoxin (DNA-binding transcriptional repressor) of toxin-antitoxin stability system
MASVPKSSATPRSAATITQHRQQRRRALLERDPRGRLGQGEAFVVTRNGVHVGELIPLRRRRFVARETVVASFAHAPSIDAARLRYDLDRHAAQDIEPRG